MNTDIQIDIRYQWTRIHNNRRNYLLIQQEATLLIENQYNRGTSIKIKDNKIQDKIYKDYETENVSNCRESNNYQYIKECMDKSNVATNDYKYFKVIFANGREIICTSFEEFLDIIESFKTVNNH